MWRGCGWRSGSLYSWLQGAVWGWCPGGALASSELSWWEVMCEPQHGHSSSLQAGAEASLRADHLGLGCGGVASLGCLNLLVGVTFGGIV